MPHPNLEKWLLGMKATRAAREETWDDICAHAPDLNREDLSRLVRSLPRKPNPDTLDESVRELRSQINQLTLLIAAQPWQRDPQTPFHEWLFRPFRPQPGGPPISNPCACISVCDREHLRDVQAQLILARYLSSDRFPDTQFHHVPLRHPDWSKIGKINALCVVGRPSMFGRCPIVDNLFAKHRNMRFVLPPDDEDWRSKPLTRTSADAFHHVSQRPSLHNSKPNLYRACDMEILNEDPQRTDYAVVQRFNCDKTRVIIIAGATSLGTVGAAEWVTSQKFADQLQRACERQGKTLREDTEMEALLQVTAQVNNPARPWGTILVEPLKLFMDDSINLLGGSIARVTLVTQNGLPDVVMFDDDEVRFRDKKAFAALVAVCKAVCRKASAHSCAAIGLNELLSDSAVASALGLRDSPDLKKAETRLRDHLQAPSCLGANVAIEEGTLKFHCELQHIDYSAVTSS